MTTTPAPTDPRNDNAPRLRGAPLILAQTGALTIDAYRQLQAKKLFWIVLAISVLVAASFAGVGINAGGLKFFWFDTIDFPGFNTSVLSPAAFYKMVFTALGVNIWLAWAAVILALISTAGMIPELIGDGSIDLYLSKPIGRSRLFLTKYLLGLLFVALQTLCFCAACFVVIGVRGGVWLPSLFWAVPIVTLFYSFIYSIAAVVGLLTGSTVAAILVTLLAWLLIFAVDATDGALLRVESGQELVIERNAGSMAFNQKAIDRMAPEPADLAAAEREVDRELDAGEDAPLTGTPTTVPADAPKRNIRLEMYQKGLVKARRAKEGAEGTLAKIRSAHRYVLWVKTPLPKTGETVGVLERVLLPPEETAAQAKATREGVSNRRRTEEARDRQDEDIEAAQRAANAYRGRSLWWSIGTSTLFEAALLGFACWRFARRDF